MNNTVVKGVVKGITAFPGLIHFTLDPALIILSVKLGGIKYHFLSLCYDSSWDYTLISWATGEHSFPVTSHNIYIYCGWSQGKNTSD